MKANLAALVVVAWVLGGCADEDAQDNVLQDAAGSTGNTNDAAAPADAAVPIIDTASADGATPDAGAATDAAASGDALTAQTFRWGAAGATLPQAACPPWILLDTAEPEDVVIAAGHFVLDTSADPEHLAYSQTAPWVLTPPVLQIEARVKLVASNSAHISRSAVAIGFTIGAAHHKNILFLEPNAIFLLSGESVRGPAVSTTTSDDFHTYRLQADTTSGAVVVFRDGQQILSGQSFPDPDFKQNRVLWGEATLLAHGRSEWEYVEHNAANLAACR